MYMLMTFLANAASNKVTLMLGVVTQAPVVSAFNRLWQEDFCWRPTHDTQ